MRVFPLILLACTAACTVEQIPIDPELGPLADPLLERAAQETPAAITIAVAQPDPYAAIIAGNFEDVRFLFDSNSRQLNLSNFGSQQILYPQVRPGAQARVSGASSLTLNVSQILFDAGAASAQSFVGQTAAISREIENLAELNDEIVEDINLYLDYHRNLKTADVLGGFSGQLRDLLSLAQTRASGGIGRANEVPLFQLQLAEIEADIAIARSNAKLALARLADHDPAKLNIAPLQPKLLEDRIPLAVMEALAEREGRRSELEVARSNTRPQVVAVANAGFDPLTGLPTNDVGIDIQANEPFTIGGNTNLRIAQENVQLAEMELAEAIKQAELNASQLLQELDALRAQEEQLGALAAQAQARLDGFQELFLAGEADITDAVSLIDTVQTTASMQISLEFQIRETQVELARLSSSLLPTLQ